MFARLSRSRSVCLRCQTRLARHAQIPVTPNSLASTAISRRWQGTAAARVEEEDNFEDGQDAPEQQTTPSPPLRHHAKQKKRKFPRSWTPSPVAQLGVSALGKPAEILVLPSRDRTITIVPSDDKSPPHKIHESIESERRPLSPEQVKENIEAVRTNVGQNRGQLDDTRWKAVRQSLVKGFTNNQLTAYIEQMQSDAAKKFHLKRMKSKWKLQMANYIAKYLWGFSGPDGVEESKEAVTKKELNVSQEQLDVLLVQKSEPLKSLSEKHKVKIDVFREQKKLVLSGNSTAVTAVRESLSKLKSQIKKRQIALDRSSRAILKWDSDRFQGFISTLGHRNGIYVVSRPRGSTLDVYVQQDDVASLLSARRDILLASREPNPSTQLSVWPLLDLQAPSLAPAYLDTQSPWSPLNAPWGRVIRRDSSETLPSTVSNFSTEQKASFSNVYKSVRDSLRNATESPLLKKADLREEFYANFGRALVNRSVSKAGSKSQGHGEKSKTIFTSQVPLLAQFLSLRKNWKSDPALAPPSETSEGSKKSPLHVRIVLSPVQTKVALPSIEIFLTGKDVALGLKQPLELLYVTAILQDISHYMLLPGHAVDVHFSRQLKRDIYSAGTQADTSFAGLLKQLAKYLNQAAGKDEASFAPFVDLKLPLQLRSAGSKVTASLGETKKSSDKDSQNSGADESEEVGKVPEYVLATVEVLDVASFATPFHSNLWLDYITYDGGQWGGNSQVFRLARTPFLEPPSKSKTRFANFFNIAYEIAAQLGNPKLLQS